MFVWILAKWNPYYVTESDTKDNIFEALKPPCGQNEQQQMLNDETTKRKLLNNDKYVNKLIHRYQFHIVRQTTYSNFEHIVAAYINWAIPNPYYANDIVLKLHVSNIGDTASDMADILYYLFHYTCIFYYLKRYIL